MASPVPSARSHGSPLLRVADAAAPALARLWRGWLQDARRTLRRQHGALRRALRFPPSLAASALLLDVWRTRVETPTRAAVPAMLLPVFDEAASIALAPLRDAVEAPVVWEDEAARTDAWLAGFVARQLQQIRQTTIRTWRRVLQEGGIQEDSPPVLARTLEETFGLTVASAAMLGRLRTRLESEGLAAAAVAQRVEQEALTAVAVRAMRIAQTATVDTVSQAALAGVVAAVHQGAVHATLVRRYWTTEEDNLVCSLCSPIPEMNPDGVGLYEPFDTPAGPIMTPTIHPNCRCEVDTRVG